MLLSTTMSERTSYLGRPCDASRPQPDGPADGAGATGRSAPASPHALEENVAALALHKMQELQRQGKAPAILDEPFSEYFRVATDVLRQAYAELGREWPLSPDQDCLDDKNR